MRRIVRGNDTVATQGASGAAMTDRHIKGDSARPDEAWGYHNATDPTFRVWSDQTAADIEKLVIKQ